jgi:hypothetical protein
MNQHRWVVWVAVVTIALCSMVYAAYLGAKVTNVDSKPNADTTIWKHYVSRKLGMSFDYPGTYRVVDNAGFPDVGIEPPPSEYVIYYSGQDNSYTLYSKDRILNPISDEEHSEVGYFSALRQYIDAAASFNNLRVASLSNGVGLYRDGDNMVGIRQSVCFKNVKTQEEADNLKARCETILKHILYSMQFVR